MTPEQFERQLARQAPEPVYLFVGPEGYRRAGCRKALLERALSPEEREEGYVRHDLDELSLAEVVDDARSMSLFAGSRVLWVGSAESAMPKGRSAAEGEEGGGGADVLAAYCQDPTPGTVVVFDAQKWDFEGEDKSKMERLAKFYAPVKAVVEFRHLTPQGAREFAQAQTARQALRMDGEALDLLVESTGGDASRIAIEVEKLSLLASGRDGRVTAADVATLVPNASETTIFALVNALARKSRGESMELLDTLVRAGEYLPLALTFLGGLFRMALAARELGLKSAGEVQSHYSRAGVAMWRARAEQIHTAGSKFAKERLEEALELVYQADLAMKSSRVDDRIVMEDFVLRLTR